MAVKKQLDVVTATSQHLISRMDLNHRIGGFDHYLHVTLPQDLDAICLRLVAYFAAEPLKEIHIVYPRDWWEAVKDRFAPAWFKRHWPVRRQEHHIDIKAIWSQFRPAKGTEKYGPFLPYVLDRSYGDE